MMIMEGVMGSFLPLLDRLSRDSPKPSLSHIMQDNESFKYWDYTTMRENVQHRAIQDTPSSSFRQVSAELVYLFLRFLKHLVSFLPCPDTFLGGRRLLLLRSLQ